ncbi:30S ribosomal protein S9 [Candidatus Velamenicoccus archaeovorus]|uniref:Small ribosomal subunit protein uS9 n=1 Tax=Velamenicoccus archaeovorus TaxID=1930593 RepID=A0A410P4R1_VELA1|nr:30S ribosomal protein S9 [Candidatus Velamenicoccus archaeovorus]QAT17197.1 30S ribosomal protein S9 [Candidatus Velamenicoccus archaeovorus]
MSAETSISTATGRRKEAIARVRLIQGEGKIVVNKRAFEDYFARETDRIIVNQPFEATNTKNKYNVTAIVDGGGLTGQAGALRHGISRALASIDTEFRHTLRKGGFLTRDPRAKERKKYGQKGARKRFQWTKR